MLDVVNALTHVDLAVRDEVYHACRALLVHRPDQIPTFDDVFAAFWRSSGGADVARRSGSAAARTTASEAAIAGEPSAESPRADVEPQADDVALRTWSDSGGVANKDFAACSPLELARVAEALEQLEWRPGQRKTRRWVRGRGARVDLRRAIAVSRRTGGDVIALPRRSRRTRPRRLVLLCDVSGSMERYARVVLLFAHGVARRLPGVEAFLFSVSLTRVTRELKARGPDAALAALSRAVPDWSGGTRIGASLNTFNQQWSRRVLSGGAVVLLISDGWDRGEPEQLRREVARLQRSCHRLVWLNPLIGTADYAPLTRGLRAALPFVDDFLPVRTLSNLSDLAAHLNGLDQHGRRSR